MMYVLKMELVRKMEPAQKMELVKEMVLVNNRVDAMTMDLVEGQKLEQAHFHK